MAQRAAAASRTAGVRCEGANLFLADGEAAFQEVLHVHLHVLPRYRGDKFKLDADWIRKPPRTELDRVAGRLRAAYDRLWAGIPVQELRPVVAPDECADSRQPRDAVPSAGCAGASGVMEMRMEMPSDPALKPLDRLVGRWTTEATHPALPGVVVRGTTVIEWLEGERFLIYRARTDHPDFPDAISIIGLTDRDRVDGATDAAPAAGGESQLRMHYFDSRGVFRVYEASIDERLWRLWRDAPGFSQRFTGTLSDGGDSIVGRWQLSRDDIHWDDDVAITYRRDG